MEENDDGKEPPPLIPRVIYQSVNLDLHLDKEGIDCETELLLVFPRKELIEGSIFYLHCRVPIDKVLINSIPAEFDLRDPLRCIHYDEDRRKNFVGKEADLNFRSALEISTQGELQLRIPNGFEAHRKSIDPLPMVPGDNPPLAAVFDSLNEVISAALDGKKQNLDNGMGVGHEGRNHEGSEGLMNLQQLDHEKDFSSDNVIVQVNISYRLKSDNIGMSKGFVYRRNVGDNGPSKECGDVSCVYTTGAGGDGVITDYDGVRCWLPCIDTSDQRAVFDVTIKAPSDFTVLTCGKLVQSLESAGAGIGKEPEHTTRRYITSHRVPAYSVGFFAGRTEEYRLPLYRISGRSHVALGLSDTIASSSHEQQEALKASVEGGDFDALGAVTYSDINRSDWGSSLTGLSDVKLENLRLSPYASNDNKSENSKPSRRRSVSFSAASSTSEGDNYDNDVGSNIDAPSMKRMRRSSPDKQDSMHGDGASGPLSGTPISTMKPLSSLSSPIPVATESSHPMISGNIRRKRSRAGISNRNLYEEVVRHSNLGLDLSVKLIHKFVGRLYGTQQSQYSQIFVRDLGAHFLSFDGFSLIDASFLHSSDQIFAEMASHLTLLRAYLYSWLMVALPLDSCDLGFLLHGVVGYLQNLYLEEVFGAAESPYRIQKCMDAAMELDKRGFGRSLWQSFPESPTSLQGVQRQYVVSKSTVLMHLLENRLGGPKCMRKALQSMVRGTCLFDAQSKHGKNDTSGAHTKPRSRSGSMGDGNSTPYAMGGTPHFETPDSVRRPGGLPLNFSTEEYLDVKGHNDCISLHSLFKILQDSAKGFLEVPDAFIAQYLRNTGALLLNVGAKVDPAADGTVRNCFINVSPHLTRPEESSSVFPMDFKLRVVETKDDLAVEEILPLTGKPETLQHEIAVKAKSNRGRRPMDPDKKAKKAKDKLSEQQVARREQIDAMIVANKDSVDLARDMQCPIKMIIPDPMCAYFYEAQLSLPVCMLVEVLYACQDHFDVYRQVQALRSLGRAGAERDESGGLVAQKSSAAITRLHLSTMVDCITRFITKTGKDPRFVRGHWDYVIAEAAFALASWQNLRAPAKAHQWETIATLNDVKFNGVTLDDNPWLGLAALLTCIRRQFMTESVSEVRPSSAFPSASTTRRQKFVPANIDLTNPTRLLTLLLAVAKIRSRNGTTPNDVVELLIAFAAHADDREPHTVQNKFSSRMDTSHYKALLLFALSQIRVEPFKGDSRGALGQISSIAGNFIRKQFRSTVMNDTRRRGIADLDEEHMSHKMVLLAMFDYNGLVTAASLGCLVEGDMQILQGDYTTFQGTIDQHLDEPLPVQPLTVGFGGVDYLNYILAPGSVVGETAMTAYHGRFQPLRPSGRSSRAANDVEVFHITTPCVRAVALEAFLRFCFMQHLLYSAKYKLIEGTFKKRGLEGNISSVHPSSAPFIPVAIHTTMLVITSDASREVRRAAAQSLRGAIEGRPARMVAKYLSHAEPLNCLGWADPEAFTTDLERSYYRELRAGVRSLEGSYATETLKLFWDTMIDCHYDQEIRSELLASWLYIFPKNGDVPPALNSISTYGSCSSSATHEELQELAALSDEIPPTMFDQYSRAINQLCGIKNPEKPPPPLSIGLPTQPRLSVGLGKARGSSVFAKTSGSNRESVAVGSAAVSTVGAGAGALALHHKPSESSLVSREATAKPIKAPALRLSLGSKKTSSANLSADSTAHTDAVEPPKKAPLARKLSLTLKRSSL